jgi:hypothetical protein
MADVYLVVFAMLYAGLIWLGFKVGERFGRAS